MGVSFPEKQPVKSWKLKKVCTLRNSTSQRKFKSFYSTETLAMAHAFLPHEALFCSLERTQIWWWLSFSGLHKSPYIAVSLCFTPVAQCPAAPNIVPTNTMMKACISQVKVEIEVTYNKLLQPKVTSHQECSQNHSAVYVVFLWLPYPWNTGQVERSNIRIWLHRFC